MEFIEDAEYDDIDDSNINPDLSIIENIENSNQIVVTNSEPETVDFTDVEEGEILSFTEYVDFNSTNSLSVITEYDNIDVVNIDKKSKKIAQDLVSKITKFIIEFDDVELTEQHQKYITEVGKLELTGLHDMLMLCEYNRALLKNMIHRINSVQAEDFAAITSYNQLINTQMRLNKELSVKYKSIPSVIKRMKAEILCNQELGKDENNYERINEEINTNLNITSQKELIRQLREKYNQ